MTLKTIFNKPVDRPIEGVIKADDETSLRLEIEEYVLTNEVEKRLELFLDAYNNYEGANGVWVSGFFGSGKSHLLKMLALLLENREVDGAMALDLFLPKCGDNEILRGDLKRAVDIPSKSILFNIDQKAAVISKTQIDALVAVFVKVFDEMCGYYGKQGYIAQFERDMDDRGIYDGFKGAYGEITGRNWQIGREQALLENENIAKAYAQVAGMGEESSMGILEKYRSQYSVSIEDFAEKIKSYIDQQGPDFRLNFFVDEVGQYIADNIKLMTNLQTIAESLATKCRGRAWVIVTAQEDMGTVLGEMDKQKGNDFSKIQDRFATRMKLTSADVAEVIQKRLLQKNDEGIRCLSDTYHEEVNNFKTLFDFADGSVSYRNFTDKEHFIHSYPFIPYQFTLFQAAIQNLSLHNAFEGKHSSVGERSMLGVFQQVAIQIGDHKVGQLATFDLMFEGIRTALKSNIQHAIIQAEQHLDNPLAIRLLKTLFLVKYVKEFKPTLRNLCVLMLDSFGQDIPMLRNNVQEALALLENQTYIQRNGEQYEYLTDEEKDVEQEIKNTEVDTTDVAAEMVKLVFDQVIKDRKIRYDDSGQDYSYSRKLDDQLHGREHELTINVISPFNDNVDKEDVLRLQNMGRDELMVVMPPDDRLVRDILMYKRTEKYIRQNITITQQEAIKRILSDKGFQNRERESELRQQVKNLLGKAKIFVAGNDIEIGSEDAQTRIFLGFQESITKAYPNLRMLRGVVYTEKDVSSILYGSQDGLFTNDATSLSEPEQEVLAFIKADDRNSVRTTLKSLMRRFEHKPYGWPYAAVLCTLAKLFVRGKIEAQVDSNILEDKELEKALLNSHAYENILLKPQIDIGESDVRALKEFYEDFFDAPPGSSEAKALGKEIGLGIQDLLSQLSSFAEKTVRFPFLTVLDPVLEKLNELSDKPYTWYLKELGTQKDTLLEMKESIIDPVRKFMSGSQKDIFDDAREFMKKHEANFAYIEGNEAVDIAGCLSDPECFKGSSMQMVKTNLDTLRNRVATKVNAEIEEVKESVARLKDTLFSMTEFKTLTEDKKNQVGNPFEAFIGSVEKQELIAVIREMLRRFEGVEYSSLLESVLNAKVTGGSDGNTKPSMSLLSSLLNSIEYDKTLLDDESDVNHYVEAIKITLLAEIRKGNRIRI